ncbi:MAG: ClC family H(+)/Cl(-) exchange transporter [Spirochaetaceae bacterium]|jgi:H+/Cl- antiporter ClcA|nr:ClC family H(+)/Cl(-) exchange transporter [Spirochaetaceae bacterium]
MILNIRRWYHARLSLLLESILIGVITGLVIAGFRYSMSVIDTLRGKFYVLLMEVSSNWLSLWTAVLMGIGFFLGWIGTVRPMVKGGGIPQIKNPKFRQPSMDWLIDLPLKFLTTILTLGSGLSLGKCGPAVQMGSYIGKGVLSIFPRKDEAQRDALISGSAAAGFAAVFNAPMSGILFVVEELRIPLSPMFLGCVMSAVTAADLTSAYYLKSGPLFDFTRISVLPVHLIPWIVLLGVVSAAMGDIFKRSLYLSLNLYDRFHIPPLFRPLIPLMISVVLGLFCFDITGGGYELINSLLRQERTAGLIGLLLAGKILFTALCAGSGAPGGLFFPILACGALTGSGLGRVLALFGVIGEGYVHSFMILGIAAFFTTVLKAPLTGMILILEMSGTINHLGTLVPVCLASFITSELIQSRPVNEVLLERMLRTK